MPFKNFAIADDKYSQTKESRLVLTGILSFGSKLDSLTPVHFR